MPEPRTIHPTTVVAEARKLIGTPYVWTQRKPGEGIDCGGIPVLLLQRFKLPYPTTTNYPSGLALVETLSRYMVEVPKEAEQDGDFLLLWVDRSTKEPRHIAVRTTLRGHPYIVHADNRDRVMKTVENIIDSKTRKRITHVFRLPGVPQWQQ